MSRIAIVGAGTMGSGIAYVSLAAGHGVMLTDSATDSLERALSIVGQALDSGVRRGKLTEQLRVDALRRLTVTGNLDDAVAGVDFVIEAAPEKLDLKRALFARISRAAPPVATLATNTSSLSISAIAAAINSPDRVIGMHFFNPVPAMRLVEIVRGVETAEATVERAASLAESMGKTPIVVRDSPGFATSRLGIVLGLEAMRMLEQGVASAADIDRAMELGYNHPVGPLRLTDIVGLDVRLAVADYLHATLGEATYAAPAILREMVAEGRIGKKSGRGFYDWTSDAG